MYGLALSLSLLRLAYSGGLAQLARAPALHAGGQRFDSVILHKSKSGNLKIREFENFPGLKNPDLSSFHTDV